jgi:hypothetical protein
MIYNFSCPSTSFFAPLDYAHRVTLSCFGLMPILLCLACCTCVILVNVITLRTPAIIIDRNLGLSLALSYRFHLHLEVCDLFLELLDICPIGFA